MTIAVTLTFGELTAQFKRLPIDQQKNFYDFAKSIVLGKYSDVEPYLFTERKFSDGKICLKCGSKNIKKHGFIGEEIRHQRYFCKECKQTFTELHNSPLHGTKKSIDTWYMYIFRMLTGGYSLKKLAEELDINIKTAFYWRHKILYALRDFMMTDKVGGVVETDETYFLQSFKGQRKGLPRPSRICGGRATKRGISNEQVCVMTSTDRKGNYLADLVCYGRVSSNGISRFFDNRLDPKSILVTDEHKSYLRFAKENQIDLKQVKRGNHVVDGIYHIQHINSFHSRLKRFMFGFNGVATKYLGNYITWCKFVVLMKSMRFTDYCNHLLEIAETTDKKTRITDFSQMTPAFV